MRGKRVIFGAFGPALALTLAACGGGSGGGGGGGEQATDGEGDADKVEVTAREFEFEASTTTFEPGVPYEFIVTNEGSVPHEMMIVDTMHNEMLMGDMGAMDEMAIATISADDLGPGETRSVRVTFEKALEGDDLELACLVPGHHDSGMHLPIAVD